MSEADFIRDERDQEEGDDIEMTAAEVLHKLEEVHRMSSCDCLGVISSSHHHHDHVSAHARTYTRLASSHTYTHTLTHTHTHTHTRARAQTIDTFVSRASKPAT